MPNALSRDSWIVSLDGLNELVPGGSISNALKPLTQLNSQNKIIC